MSQLAMGETIRSDYRAAVEHQSRTALVATQWDRLLRNLRRIYRVNRYYGRIFDSVGLTPEKIRSPADYRQLPVTTKREVLADVAAHPPYGSRLQVRRERLVGIAETSGTSGLGQEVYAKTARDRLTYQEMECFGFWWAGVRPGKVVVLTVPVTTTAAGQWYYGALLGMRCHLLPLGNYDARRKLTYLQRYGCDVLIASPSYLRRLTAAASEIGWPPRASSLIVAGEAYSRSWAARMQQEWDARLYEQYGCTQRAIGWTCERGALPDGRPGVVHLLEHLVYCEVLDPASGEPVGPGEEGELVITPLQADASPLLRFATGDRVRWLPAEACPCGRPFAGLEAGTIARYDHMLKIKMVNVWPDAVDAIVLALPEALEYQGEVRVDPTTGREEAAVSVEFRPDVPPSERAALLESLAARLHEHIGLHFVVHQHEGPSLVRGMRDDLVKRQRWIDHRQSE